MAGRHWTPEDIPDLSGKTALVTGANSGIGLRTARTLAEHGARVILGGRDGARLEEAMAAITAELPTAPLRMEPLVFDLGDLASVSDAAARLAATETIDILVNNAGVMNIPTRTTTKDGLETTFAVDHLGPFALTLGLLPSLGRSPAARIVTVSAIASRWPSGRSKDLLSESRYRPMGAYARAKRANVVFTHELNRRLSRTSIRAFVVHPGAAMTGLQRNGDGALARLLTSVAERFLMGTADGAAWPSLYAATADAAEPDTFIGPAGRRQSSGTPKPVRQPRGAADPAEGEWLWRESERLTDAHFDPGAVSA